LAAVAGSVAPWPDNAGGNDGIPPAELYKSAVEEYRFQAQYNWSRTQYLLAFNAAILTAASAVASRPGRSAALVFLLGMIASILSTVVVRTQHDYYRAARKRMVRIEMAYNVPPDQRVDSTSTLGKRKRLISVNQVIHLLLVSVAVGDAVGAIIIWQR
jgi:hypothetical protein